MKLNPLGTLVFFRFGIREDDWLGNTELCAVLYLRKTMSPPPTMKHSKHVVHSNCESVFVTESLNH